LSDKLKLLVGLIGEISQAVSGESTNEGGEGVECLGLGEAEDLFPEVGEEAGSRQAVGC
jgi:hypothetical protein